MSGHKSPSLKALLEMVRKVVADCYPEAASASLVIDRGTGNEPAVIPVAMIPRAATLSRQSLSSARPNPC